MTFDTHENKIEEKLPWAGLSTTLSSSSNPPTSRAGMHMLSQDVIPLRGVVTQTGIHSAMSTMLLGFATATEHRSVKNGLVFTYLSLVAAANPGSVVLTTL